MKQRLLLALLMLLTSAGFMKAQTMKVTPWGTSDVVLTFDKVITTLNPASNANVQLSTDQKTLTIKATYGANEVSFSTDAATSMTVTGNVKKIEDLANSSLTKLTCTGNSLNVLNLTYSIGLKTLNASSNKISSLTLPSSGSALATVNLSQNALASLDVSNLTQLESLDVSKNQLSSLTLTGLTNLKTLKVDKNKITTITGLPTGLTPDYGTQTLTASGDGFPANEGWPVAKALNSLLGSGASLSASDLASIGWERLDGTEYESDNITVHKSTTVADGYLFYDSSKNNLYVDGTYCCNVTISSSSTSNYKGRKFRLENLKVKPAQVSLSFTKLNNLQNVGVTGTTTSSISFSAVGTPQTVSQGETLTFTATAKDANYDAASTVWSDLVGLVPAAADSKAPYTGTSYKFKVAATYATSGPKASLSAEASGYSHKVIFDNKTPQVGGNFTVYKVVGTEKVSLSSGDVVLNGEQLLVSVNVNAGYTPTVLVNKESKPLKVETNVTTNVINYTTEPINITNTAYPSSIEIPISVNFKAENLTLTALVDGKKPSDSGSSFAGIDYLFNRQIDIRQKNGATVSSISDGSGKTSVEIQSDTQYEATFAINDHYRLKDITINGGKLVSIAKNYEEQTTPRMVYTVVFNVEKSNVEISITTRQQQQLTVNDVKNGATTQSQVYDGKEKPVLFTTTPAGHNSKLKVTYKEGSTDYGEKVPSEFGSYEAKFSIIDLDGDFYLNTATTLIDYNIEKADLVIETLPTVTVTSDAKYAITGGKVTFNDKEVEGKWSITPATPTGDQLTTSHTAKVKFEPKVDKNFKDAEAQVTVKVGNTSLTTYKVSVKTLPTGYQLKWYNGQKEVNISSETFPAGTELIAVLTFPKGTKGVAMQLVDASLQEQTGNDCKQDVAKSSDGNYVYTVTVEAAVSLEVVAGKGNKYTVKFEKQSSKYSGVPQEYSANNVTIADVNGQSVDFASVKAVISYKDIDQPKDAGTYTVIVTIPADEAKGYVETVASDAVFTIEKIDPVILTMPKSTLLAKGQRLEMSDLVSGASNIPGKFGWVDPTKTFSTAGQYKEDINFTPADEYLKNYNVLSPKAADGTSLQVAVEVSAIQILTFVQPVEGSILVANQDGKYLETGSAISKGDVLTITVVPKENFKLKSILVNGASSGNVITVGESSIAIEATFEVDVPEPEEPEIDPNSQYAVTVTKSLRGAVINKPGVNAVKKDQPFSFTVTTLPADASKIKVTAGGSVITPSSTGVYTIAKVTSNMTVDVSFTSTPTALTIDVPREYKNKGGYLVGRVQVEGPSDGKCYYNDEITLVAFPESGVKFTRWTGDKISSEQVLTVVLTGNLKMEANFSGTPTGIEDIMAASITTGKGSVWVRGIANADVTIVSIAGRVQARQRISGDTRIDVPAGIYVVVLESGSDVKRVKVIVK